MYTILYCIAIATVLYFLYKKLWSVFGYWKKRGVVSPKPNLIFGNVVDNILGKKSLGEIYGEIYRKYKNAPYVGIYNMREPNILIRDPELVHEVLTKRFPNFRDNTFKVDEKADPLFARNPFTMKGDEWKESRGQITPSFTPVKLKAVVPILHRVAERLTNFIEENAEKSLESKDTCNRFTVDAVFECIYGINAGCFEKEDSVLRKRIKELFVPSMTLVVKIFAIALLPSLASILRVSFFPKEFTKYLIDMTSETAKYRQKHNIVRNDYFDIVNEIKNRKTGEKISNLDMTAHLSNFLLDGTETSSILFGFTLFTVASHPDVQGRLQKEIDGVLEKYQGELNYDALQEMPYLECVVNETLRLYPPALFFSRACTEPCTLKSDNFKDEKGLLIEKDMGVIIPLYALHMDPNFFPEPEKFDPERFSVENKNDVPKGAYLPFGGGPRVCLGKNFGLLQVKVGAVNILKKFNIAVNKKTILPLQMDPHTFLMQAKGGLWLDFTQRKS